MKAILLTISVLLLGIAAVPCGDGISNAATATIAEVNVGEDECECETMLTESDGQWMVSVKNPCKTSMIADCWYLVEYSDGTKDTETLTINVPADSTINVASDLLTTSHCLEHGCASRPE